MIADEHLIFSHVLEGFPVHVARERDGILLRTSRHRHPKKSGVEVVHIDSLLLKGLQRSMVSQAPSRLGATVYVEGWTHSYEVTYELSRSRSGICGLRGPALASLVKNYRTAATSNGTSAITPLTLRDPLVGIPFSSGAQASLRAF